MMFPLGEPQAQRTQDILFANLGPLLLGAGCLAAARFSQIATFDAGVKGLTTAAIVEVALVILAQSIVLLAGCASGLTGGRPAGFRGLAALPRERIGRFAPYALLFNLWFMGLAAVLTRIPKVALDDGSTLTISVAIGVVMALTLILMVIQLGFLFPDVLHSGETSILFAMALGLSSVRRIVAALAVPVGLLFLPQAVLAAWIWDGPGMVQAAEAWPSIAQIVLVLGVSLMASAGLMAAGAAIARIYLDLTQQLPDSAWR